MEIAVIISILSFAFTAFQIVVNIKRNSKLDDKYSASEITTIIVKLEHIVNDLSEIKSDLRSVKSDLKDHAIRIAKLEQQIELLNKEGIQ